jgi:hypothetical protein
MPLYAGSLVQIAQVETIDELGSMTPPAARSSAVIREFVGETEKGLAHLFGEVSGTCLR